MFAHRPSESLDSGSTSTTLRESTSDSSASSPQVHYAQLNVARDPYTDAVNNETSGSSNSDCSNDNNFAQYATYPRHISIGNDSFPSLISSRAPSPGFDGTLTPQDLIQRSVSRGRSRNASGASTPTFVDKEGGYVSDNYFSDFASSQLQGRLHSMITGSGHKKRSAKPGWFNRAEASRRRLRSSTSSLPFPTSHAYPSRTGRYKSCLSVFGSALLRQPWMPTQPITILFFVLVLGCIAATVTTFLFSVLSTDKYPLPWRTYCQEQQPFPHALADSLAPVDVFVGIFVRDNSFERRQMIRSTYARHTLPIDPQTGRPGHNVQVKFILGRPNPTYARRIALETEMYNDIVVLDIPENMNRGKTHAYFKWAAQNATVPVFYTTAGASDKVSVGFKKADYVVKADDDSFIVLSELERHLRVTPRQKTYWGYLIRNLFMGGKVYALSADLVQYVATYAPLLAYTTGPEDKRVAKWMRMHPSHSTINWITERCWIYDHPKASTTYVHGFLFPDEVERIRAEGRRGITEEERIRRGGDNSQAWSTVTEWKKDYKVPMEGLTIEEEIETMIEGGGRWPGFRGDDYRGPNSLRWENAVFDVNDSRLVYNTTLERNSERLLEGLKPGIPQRIDEQGSRRKVQFGKDLFREPSDVEAIQRKAKRQAGGIVFEIHNSVEPAEEDEDDSSIFSKVASVFTSSIDSSTTTKLSSTTELKLTSEFITSSSFDGETTSSEDATSLITPIPEAETTIPVMANPILTKPRIPAHNYVLPPDAEDIFIAAPTHRYDQMASDTRSQRMLNLPYGGTVTVHYLKRNEWFMETALALLGREKMWDGGIPSTMHDFSQLHQADGSQLMTVPLMSGSRKAYVVSGHWGGARMYGSPIVRENGYVDMGRSAEARREVDSIPNRGAMNFVIPDQDKR